jgi:hypothetical protein
MTLLTTLFGLFVAYLATLLWLMDKASFRIWLIFDEDTAMLPAAMLAILHVWAAGLLTR